MFKNLFICIYIIEFNLENIFIRHGNSTYNLIIYPLKKSFKNVFISICIIKQSYRMSLMKPPHGIL